MWLRSSVEPLGTRVVAGTNKTGKHFCFENTSHLDTTRRSLLHSLVTFSLQYNRSFINPFRHSSLLLISFRLSITYLHFFFAYPPHHPCILLISFLFHHSFIPMSRAVNGSNRVINTQLLLGRPLGYTSSYVPTDAVDTRASWSSN